MTKTIVIGKDENNKKKNPIVFYEMLERNRTIVPIMSYPQDWKFIELICSNYATEFDLMFAYNDPNSRDWGVLVLGKWNDGVV